MGEKMPLPSSIDRLPTEAREALDGWLRDPAITQIEAAERVNALLEKSGQSELRVSQDAVGRYRRRLREDDEKLRQSRVIGEVLADKFGSAAAGQVGHLVTSMTLPSRSLLRFYNKRGTAEQWIKEGKQATCWSRLSCHRFRANEVRLQLAVLADNLGNLWRRLGLRQRIKNWSLTSWQQRLMKTGGRLIKRARYDWLLLAEGHLNRRLFGEILGQIRAVAVPGGSSASRGAAGIGSC